MCCFTVSRRDSLVPPALVSGYITCKPRDIQHTRQVHVHIYMYIDDVKVILCFLRFYGPYKVVVEQKHLSATRAPSLSLSLSFAAGRASGTLWSVYLAPSRAIQLALCSALAPFALYAFHLPKCTLKRALVTSLVLCMRPLHFMRGRPRWLHWPSPLHFDRTINRCAVANIANGLLFSNNNKVLA